MILGLLFAFFYLPVAAHLALFARLKKEHELLSETRTEWPEWRDSAIARVNLFLRQDLNLTRDYFDAEGHSVFHRRTQENLRRLQADPSDEVMEDKEIACL